MPRLILQVDARQAGPVLAQLGTQLSALGATVRVTDSRINSLGSSANRAARGGLHELHRAGDQVGHMFLRMGAAMAGLAFVRLGKEVTDSWLAMDRFSRAFRAGAGDALRGGQELEFVRSESHRLGLDLESTADSYSRFMVALRLSGATMGETRKIFTAVSEAATVLGLDNERTERTFLALEQMASKGKVSMEELRRQLGQHIPGAMQIAADAMGVTTAKLFKMVESGQLLSRDLLPKFAEQLRKVFGPELASALDSPQVAFGRLRTALFELRVAAGEELVPALAELTKFLYELSQSDEARDAVRSLGAAFVKLGEDISNLFGEGGGAEDLARITEFFRSVERVLDRVVRKQNEQPVLLDLPAGWEKFQEWLRGAPEDTDDLSESLETLKYQLGESTKNLAFQEGLQALPREAKKVFEDFGSVAAEGGKSAGDRLAEGARAGLMFNPFFRWIMDLPDAISAAWSKLDNPFLKLFEDAERLVSRARDGLKKLRARDPSIIETPGIKGLPDSLEDAIAMMKEAGKETGKLEALLRSNSDAAGELSEQQLKLLQGWRDQATVAAHVASKIGEGETAMWRAETAGEAFLALVRAQTTALSELGKMIIKEIFEREINRRLMENEQKLRKNNEKLIDNETAALRDYTEQIREVQKEQGAVREGELLTFGPTFTVEDIERTAGAELSEFQRKFQVWLERKNAELEKIPAEFRFIFAPTYEQFVSEIQEQWQGATVNMAEVWRGFVEGIQDIFADTFKKLFRGQLDSWKDLWDAVLDLAIDTLAEIAAKWATQQFVMNVSSQGTGTGGFSWGSIMQMFGGGGGQPSGWDFGPGNVNDAGSGGWASSAFAWGTVAAIIGAIGFAEGWWGKSGKDALGGVSFGGARDGFGTFDITDTWSAGGRGNTKVVLDKVRAAIEEIKEFLAEVDLEIVALGDTVVQKKGDHYEILARGMEDGLFAATAAYDLAGKSAEEIADAVATFALRTATFGDSVSEFVQAVIHNSDAITQEQLKAEIELARMVENFGKTDVEIEIGAVSREMDKIFSQLVKLLSGNIQQLSFGLNQTVQEEISRWVSLRRSITGEEASQEELLEMKRREAQLFNAEKALRIAELKSRVELLKVEKELASRRTEFGIENIRILTRMEQGYRNMERAVIRGRASFALATAEIYSAEQMISQKHVETMGAILDVAATALDAEIAALEGLIEALENIPDIDLSKIKLPNVGSVGSDAAGDRDRLRDIIRAFNVSLMSDVEQAIAGINARFEENKRLARGDAELLEQVNKMREKELELLKEQLVLDPVKEFLFPGGGGTFGLSGWEEQESALRERFEAAREANQKLLEETGERAIAFWRLNQAEIRALHQLAEEAIASLGLPLEGTRERFLQLSETLAFLRAQVDKGILSKERYAEVIGQVADAEFLALGDALMGFVERYYGNVEGFEDFRRKLEQVRFELELANLRLQFQLVRDLGLLTKETIELIEGTFDWIENNAPTFPNLPSAPPAPPPTPSGPSLEDLQREREQALETLQGFLDLELNPYERELKELTETFDELRRVLGNTVEVQRAWELALNDLNERYTRGLRDFLDTLRDPALTQAQQFETVRERFLALAATGDISRSDELLRLAEQLRTLGASALGSAGGGFQALLDLIESQLLMFLGESVGPPGQQLPGSTVTGNAGPGAAGAEAFSVVSSVNRGNTLLERIEQVLISVEQNTASLGSAAALRASSGGLNEDQVHNYLRMAAQNTAQTAKELRSLRDEARNRTNRLPPYAVDVISAQGGKR